MTSILFDAPGPRTRSRHRLYSLATLLVLLALLGLLVARLVEYDQFAYEKWEPFLTPAYIQAILVDGLVETLKMAVARPSSSRSSSGWSSGSERCRTRLGRAGPAGSSSNSSAPCRCCCS